MRTWNVTLRQACIEKMKFCILLMLADKIFTCVAPIASARVQALLATSILFNARKSVGGGSVFSLSFGPFLSLYLATKEKEKDISKKLFISKIAFLLFLLYCDKRRKSKQKEETTHCFLQPYGC